MQELCVKWQAGSQYSGGVAYCWWWWGYKCKLFTCLCLPLLCFSTQLSYVFLVKPDYFGGLFPCFLSNLFPEWEREVLFLFSCWPYDQKSCMVCVLKETRESWLTTCKVGLQLGVYTHYTMKWGKTRLLLIIAFSCALACLPATYYKDLTLVAACDSHKNESRFSAFTQFPVTTYDHLIANMKSMSGGGGMCKCVCVWLSVVRAWQVYVHNRESVVVVVLYELTRLK